MKSSFVTATNIVGKIGFAEKSKLNDVYDYHDKLNGLVDVSMSMEITAKFIRIWIVKSESY